jgi:hypothetical protein
METFRYNAVQPNVVKSYYQGGDTVQFVCNNVGRQVVQGSWRLEGKLYVGGTQTNAGTWDAVSDVNNPNSPNWVSYDGSLDVKYDALAGSHGFIQQIDTYFGSSLVEPFREYGRYVALETSTHQTRDGLQGELDNTSELKFANDDMTKKFLRGTTSASSPLPFSMKLRNCINKTSGDLSYSKTGTMTLRITLSPSRNALYGSGLVNGDRAFVQVYCMSDLRLVWVDVPEQSSQGVSMEIVNYTTYDLKSATTQISATIPNPVEKFSMVFYSQNDLLNSTINYLQMKSLPNLQRVEYNIGNRDVPISFPLENLQEILYHAFESVDCNKMIVSDENTLITRGFNTFLGLDLGFSVSNGLFGINITTDGGEQNSIGASNAFLAHLYFRGRVNV